MPRYQVGDEVVLKIRDTFGYSDVTYRGAKVQVIGCDMSDSSDFTQYLCYVPPYENVPKTFKINRTHVRHLGVHPKFFDEQGCFITVLTDIYQHIPTKPGVNCDRCDEFCEGAERIGEQPYYCRACRENPYR